MAPLLGRTERIALLRACGATPDNVQRLSPSQRCDNLGAIESHHDELVDSQTANLGQRSTQIETKSSISHSQHSQRYCLEALDMMASALKRNLELLDAIERSDESSENITLQCLDSTIDRSYRDFPMPKLRLDAPHDDISSLQAALICCSTHANKTCVRDSDGHDKSLNASTPSPLPNLIEKPKPNVISVRWLC